jgi:predicted deacylase
MSRKQIVFSVVVLAALLAGLLYVAGKKKLPPPTEFVAKIEVATSTPIHTVIGTSVEGRAIDAYKFGTGSTTILFVGGIHGGYEWNSELLAYTFMDYLSAHPDFIPSNVSVTVIPSANPDGLYKITSKEGKFSLVDVATTTDQSPGRFNADKVDLNRNFGCKWQPEGMWRNAKVSGGTTAFSEPESQAIRDYALANHPTAAIFWHSMSNAVYASECKDGILPATLEIMNTYADAAGYPKVKSFNSYPVTGDAEGWLASQGIPAITVELKTHDTIEWDRNLAGIKALLNYYNVL